MTLNLQSKYPNRRTYVLKVRVDAQPDALAGRLENLITGRQREFASGHELLAAIAAELEAGDDGVATRTTGRETP
jgi:predicted metalloprotease